MAEQILHMQDPAQWQALCGNFDENIRTLEQLYEVTIVCRDTEIKVNGAEAKAAQAAAVLQSLLQMLETGQPISLQTVRYAAMMVRNCRHLQTAAFASPQPEKWCVPELLDKNATSLPFRKIPLSLASALPEPEKPILPLPWQSKRSSSIPSAGLF